MHHYASQLVDLLLVLVAAWMVLAIIFFIYAYFAGLKHPVSESVFGRAIVISFFIITMSIWLPIIMGRFNPIVDRLFVVPLQGITTRVARRVNFSTCCSLVESSGWLGSAVSRFSTCATE